MQASEDLEQRLAYLDLGPEDLELLCELRPLLEQHAEDLVAAFYRHLLSFEPTRRLLLDPAVQQRLLALQREYLLSLAGPHLDEAYLAQRRRIGKAHERIGLEPRWYLGAYALYFSLLAPLVSQARVDEPRRAVRTLVALQRLLWLDASLAMETYLDVTIAASSSALVSGLAHEIGTPMGVIQGHARKLEEVVSGDAALWRLRTIQEQIGRISRIIQTLLGLVRPRSRRRVPVALEPVIARSLSFAAERLAQRGVEVGVRCEPVPSILGDAERLQQLLLNLVLNACDAMPEGGELRISLALTPKGEVEVRVGDSGSGIPEGDLERIFEPFFTSKPAGEGFGLGLVVARGIASDHAGTLEVESRVGEGSEFRVCFPAA